VIDPPEDSKEDGATWWEWDMKKQLRLVGDKAELCNNKLFRLQSLAFHFFNCTFKDWKPNQDVPGPRPDRSPSAIPICRQYVEYAYPGIDYKEANHIQSSLNFIDIFEYGGDFYFFKVDIKDKLRSTHIRDNVSYCQRNLSSQFARFHFFRCTFENWNPDEVAGPPPDMHSHASICRQYFEYAYPGIQYTDAHTVGDHDIQSSLELIDIFQFAGELYFFKAKPHAMSQLSGHPELNEHILSFMEPLHAAKKRAAAHSFKGAGRHHILDRLRLDFPLTYVFFYQPSGAHTEEVIGGINSILVSVLREYSLVTNVEIKLVNNARTALSEIIEQWAEMRELLNMTRTLTFFILPRVPHHRFAIVRHPVGAPSKP
jgi:hypothetical protein